MAERTLRHVGVLDGDCGEADAQMVLTYWMEKCRCASESDATACSRCAAVVWLMLVFECAGNGQTRGMAL